VDLTKEHLDVLELLPANYNTTNIVHEHLDVVVMLVFCFSISNTGQSTACLERRLFLMSLWVTASVIDM
jgi:hypothetical protein